MKSEGKEHALASLLGGFISVVVLLLLATQPEKKLFSWSVWGPAILTLIISALALNFLVMWRRTRKPFSWIPALEKSSGLSQKIMDAKYNFCAISSKDPALWRSPTFMSYLMDNATKTLSQMSTTYPVSIELSKEVEDKENYIRDCRQAMQMIGNCQDPEGFTGIRLMVYDSKVLKEEEKLLGQMISLHAKGGMYCIPVRKDVLIENMLSDDKLLISNWLASMDIQYKRKEAAVIPDVLIIDNHSLAKPSGDSVWWFEKGVWQTGKYKRDFDNARIGFAMLCRKALESNAISSDFTPSLVEAVAIPSRTALVKRFFSLPYFEQWLKKVLEPFQQWFHKEEELLLSLAETHPNSTVLDVGCGEGRHARVLAKRGVKVIGVDNNPTMIERATSNLKFDPAISKNIEFYLEDAQKMHFEKETFDFIICMTNTFGNMPGIEENVLKEMARVLKQDGRIILSVYCNDSYWVNLREQTYKDIGLHIKYRNGKVIQMREGLYSRHFSKTELQEICRSAGLNPTIEEFTQLAYICKISKLL